MSDYLSHNPYASPQDSETLDVGHLAEAARLMGGTQPWLLMFGIVSLLLAALCALGTVAVAFLMLAPNGMAMGAAMAALYLMITLFYGAIGVLLCRYAIAAGEFRRCADVSTLTKALRVQKSFWKLAGILFLVFFALYILAAIAVAIVGLTFAPDPPVGGPGAFPFDAAEIELEEP